MSELITAPGSLDLDPAVAAAIAAIGALDWRYDPDPQVVLEAPESFGFYEGLPPRLEFLSDGRLVRLLADIAYNGSEGVRWPVPEGIEVNGASIPRPLWSLIGGPFEGRYRDASIVHDHYCDIQTRDWRDVHRMFHDAMRCSGVGPIKAKILFYSVYRFGPRWPSPLEAPAHETFVPAEPLTAREAPSLAYDAEAIQRHHLTLEEIEALADTRAEAALAEGASIDLEGPGGAVNGTALARLLSIPGGRATPEDVALIASRAAQLPAYVLARFEKKGVRLVACRDSVTDFERNLRGVVPRGWERTGKTWDDVPGAYLPQRNRVVVATIDKGGARAIPDKSSGKHGSSDLLIHEALHGFDFASGHAVLGESRFRDARTADFAKLHSYEQQAGDAGLQETFAESGARFLVEPGAMAASWPALHGYWRSGPANVQRTGVLESVAPTDGPIGTVQLQPDGAIALDLRAENEDGAIGHAQFTINPGDQSYDSLKEHAFSMQLEGVDSDPTLPRPYYP